MTQGQLCAESFLKRFLLAVGSVPTYPVGPWRSGAQVLNPESREAQLLQPQP